MVLDAIETLFASLPNPVIPYTELRRLPGWLEARGLTAVIAGKRGDAPGAPNRQRLE